MDVTSSSWCLRVVTWISWSNQCLRNVRVPCRGSERDVGCVLLQDLYAHYIYIVYIADSVSQRGETHFTVHYKSSFLLQSLKFEAAGTSLHQHCLTYVVCETTYLSICYSVTIIIIRSSGCDIGNGIDSITPPPQSYCLATVIYFRLFRLKIPIYIMYGNSMMYNEFIQFILQTARAHRSDVNILLFRIPSS